MFKLPTMENVAQITVDDTVVKNNKEPLITYSKDKKTTAA
jgi:ATP-dependent protease Clp ATPase subunit